MKIDKQMNLFKKDQKVPSFNNEKLARGIVMFCLQKQNKLACYLSNKFNKLSPGKKKSFLLIFILLFAGIAVFIFLNALGLESFF